jgi:hypothetical protein
MKIAFRDFERTAVAGFFGLGIPAMSLQETVAAANRWISDSGVEVLNVETLIATDRYTAKADVDGVAIRVWYSE